MEILSSWVDRLKQMKVLIVMMLKLVITIMMVRMVLGNDGGRPP